MEVDDEEQPSEDGHEADHDGEMEDAQVDNQSSPKKARKSKKKRGRKSELDMQALTDEQVALAALESDQILHLRLRKKYYAEGLNFIRQMENGMKVVEQLLASTNKPEVLEAMEFFRVTHEYQLDGAAVRPDITVRLSHTDDR